MFAMLLYLTLDIQTLMGYLAVPDGIRFLPFTWSHSSPRRLTGRLSDRVPARALLFVGLTLTGAGLLLMRDSPPDSSWTVFLTGLPDRGAGIGMVNPVLAFAAIGVVNATASGMAAGINNTFRQVGAATGIAALGRSSRVR